MTAARLPRSNKSPRSDAAKKPGRAAKRIRSARTAYARMSSWMTLSTAAESLSGWPSSSYPTGGTGRYNASAWRMASDGGAATDAGAAAAARSAE